ncbi:MAG: riboflavin biosynthesis protein RibD, partial [Proteobacteria bacterium]|nr:riboflavin biosynthesis protein RibD [Pseudomonadota bacterium]
MKSSSKSSASPSDRADREHQRAALVLAERGLGRVAPNPAVGCVIVKDGRVVARGWTQPGG